MSEETVEQMLNALAAADNKVATARGALKDAEAEYEAVADRIFQKLDAEGADSISSKKVGLKADIRETEAHFVQNFDDFAKFLIRHKAVELLQRRLSDPAIRAMIEQRGGTPIPGVGTFKKRKLHVTKVRS